MEKFAKAIHEGLVETAEVGTILHFLGEDIAGITFASDVIDLEVIFLDPFADSIFTKFHIPDVLSW